MVQDFFHQQYQGLFIKLFKEFCTNGGVQKSVLSSFFCWKYISVVSLKCQKLFEVHNTILWFWGLWGALAPHLLGKYVIPGDPSKVNFLNFEDPEAPLLYYSNYRFIRPSIGGSNGSWGSVSFCLKLSKVFWMFFRHWDRCWFAGYLCSLWFVDYLVMMLMMLMLLQ